MVTTSEGTESGSVSGTLSSGWAWDSLVPVFTNWEGGRGRRHRLRCYTHKSESWTYTRKKLLEEKGKKNRKKKYRRPRQSPSQYSHLVGRKKGNQWESGGPRVEYLKKKKNHSIFSSILGELHILKVTGEVVHCVYVHQFQNARFCFSMYIWPNVSNLAWKTILGSSAKDWEKRELYQTSSSSEMH